MALCRTNEPNRQLALIDQLFIRHFDEHLVICEPGCHHLVVIENGDEFARIFFLESLEVHQHNPMNQCGYSFIISSKVILQGAY
jgi:hypothetical protein